MAEDRPLSTEQSRDIQTVYLAHVRTVFAFVYTRVGNREAAEDITSDVFLKALTHLDLTRPEHSVVAWLFCVARHAVTDYWRAGHGAAVIPLEEARAAHRPASAPHTSAPTQEQAAARARAVLAQLPETYRMVLSCRVLEGLSVAETAHLLGTSAANVKVLQHRALKHAATLREDGSRDG